EVRGERPQPPVLTSPLSLLTSHLSRFCVSYPQKVLQQSLAVFRSDRLRMELHAVQRELAVLHRPDLAALATVTRPGGHDEVVRQPCPLYDQRVIAHRREG